MGIPIKYKAKNISDAIEHAKKLNDALGSDVCKVVIHLKKFRIRFDNLNDLRAFDTFVLLNSNKNVFVEFNEYKECTISTKSLSIVPWLIFDNRQYVDAIKFEPILNTGTILSADPKYYVL